MSIVTGGIIGVITGIGAGFVGNLLGLSTWPILALIVPVYIIGMTVGYFSASVKKNKKLN